MKSARQLTVAFWTLNILLGLAIVAYAATSFIGKRHDPLEDVRAIETGGNGTVGGPTYVREMGPMQRVAVIENKVRNADPGPSVNLGQFLTVLNVMSTLASCQLVIDPSAQFWMAPGDGVESALKAKRPDDDFSAARGWRVKALVKAENKVVFTNGKEEQFLVAGAATAPDGVDPNLVGKAYNAGDYQTKETLSHPTRKSYLMDPRELEWAIANQESVLTSGATFSTVDGGLRMTYVNPTSILAARGFEKDDVVQRVNGLPIASLEDVRNLKTNPQFQNARVVSVVVNRAGQQVYLTYSIPAPPTPPKR